MNSSSGGRGFSRRGFLTLSGGGAVLSVASQKMPAGAAGDLTARDKWGGCPAIRFEATGFFRLEKTDRWWLVSPDGNAFLSYGLNHVGPRVMTTSYNKQFWAKKFGVDPNAGLEVFRPGFEAKVQSDLKYLGMNSVGCHSSTGWFSHSFVPYVYTVRAVNICHYMSPTGTRNVGNREEDFLDVFADDFVQHCERIARREVAPRKDDPYLLGYSMTDCPVLTEWEALPRDNNIFGVRRPGTPTWPKVLRNLGQNNPGKRVYVETMRRLYHNDIKAFNNTYNTAFQSFDDLLRAVRWRLVADPGNSREARDNREFLVKIVDRCFEVEVAAIRRYDSNHLIFGDKFNGNTDVPDEIVALHGKHFDLMFFQYYANWYDIKRLLNRFQRITGKAAFHGDSSYSVPKKEMPNPYGPHCVNQQVRAERFRESFQGAFARKDFVGWNWCGWLEYWAALRPDKQHSGVQDAFGKWDQPLADEMMKFSRRLYQVAVAG